MYKARTNHSGISSCVIKGNFEVDESGFISDSSAASQAASASDGQHSRHDNEDIDTPREGEGGVKRTADGERVPGESDMDQDKAHAEEDEEEEAAERSQEDGNSERSGSVRSQRGKKARSDPYTKTA